MAPKQDKSKGKAADKAKGKVRIITKGVICISGARSDALLVLP